MKSIPLITFALLTTVAAAEAKPLTDPDPIPAPIAIDISDSLQRLDQIAHDGQDLMPELKALEHIVSTLPTVESLRARMSGYVQQMAERAGQTYVDHLDVAQLRQQFVAARLERAIGALEDRARGGGWSAAQYQSVVSEWVARARIFVDAPDPVAYRARLQAALMTAYQNASGLAQMVVSMRLWITTGQLIDAKNLRLRRPHGDRPVPADIQFVAGLTARRQRLIADLQRPN